MNKTKKYYTPRKPQSKSRRARATAYPRGQHDLICRALKISSDPQAPGPTAYEAVCELLMNIDEALAAKTLTAAKKALRTEIGSRGCLRLYGTASLARS